MTSEESHKKQTKPKLEKQHDQWKSQRIGEAKNPGPGKGDRKRKKEKKQQKKV